MENRVEVADIFRAYGASYRETHHLPIRHLRVMRAIEICRTSKLGGHKYKCDACGHIDISYNSCRNRHCPKCQNLEKERWLLARKSEVLPTHYFHLVFTLPAQLRPLTLRNQKICYNILFKSVSETLKEVSKDPKRLGADIGFIAVLHTWSQTLIDHPHVHCIVPGGGLSLDGKRWISSKRKFFVHVKVLSIVYRGKFLDYLKKAYKKGDLKFDGRISSLFEKRNFDDFIDILYRQNFHIYCKRPFKSSEKAIEYLGRYTHRVAISNNRITKFKDDRVKFKYRDYSDGDRIKEMTITAFEFIRRFLLHVLPDQFFKIRYYGFLSTIHRKDKLLRCKELLGAHPDDSDDQKISWRELLEIITGIDPALCPVCKKGNFSLIAVLEPICERSPPS